MASPWLLDSGFVIALLDERDDDHEECVTVWGQLRGPFITVEGVLVESTYLLRRNPVAVQNALGLIAAAEAEVVAPTAERYQRAGVLMDRYSNVPMDLVDALLVCVAEERSLTRILTLDRRGFETFRIHGRSRFEILPGTTRPRRKLK